MEVDEYEVGTRLGRWEASLANTGLETHLVLERSAIVDRGGGSTSARYICTLLTYFQIYWIFVTKAARVTI